MTDWVNLILPTQTFQLPRNFILEAMPQSSLAEALRQNSWTTDITLDNPAITPPMMQDFIDWSQGRTQGMGIHQWENISIVLQQLNAGAYFDYGTEEEPIFYQSSTQPNFTPSQPPYLPPPLPTSIPESEEEEEEIPPAPLSQPYFDYENIFYSPTRR